MDAHIDCDANVTGCITNLGKGTSIFPISLIYLNPKQDDNAVSNFNFFFVCRIIVSNCNCFVSIRNIFGWREAEPLRLYIFNQKAPLEIDTQGARTTHHHCNNCHKIFCSTPKIHANTAQS
uniref:Uncharacterized protein n=1 Tax=Ditylum brightwellii TaxID=49249 RepID=A0A7S4R632_9STRA